MPTRLLSSIGVLLVVAPTATHACGGLFCDLQLPVNQIAEQIIFHQAKDEVTAVVRIQYSGPGQDFAWVVPVAGVPRLAVASDELFQVLETVTRPQFALVSHVSRCPPQDIPMIEAGRDGVPGAGAGGGGGPQQPADPVQILIEETVGPFDTQVVTSADPEALARWLMVNGYDLSDRGAELIAPYVAEGLNFVTLKLTKRAEVGEIRPLVMQYRYDSARPMIPLRLTAVAAAPDMGIAVWIVAGTRAIPLNYPHVTVDYAQLDWYRGNTAAYASYQQLVTQAMNEAGGQGFATDFAGHLGASIDQLPMTTGADEIGRELFAGDPYVTRMYTTLSPEEMTLDPVFAYNEDLDDQPVLRTAELHVYCEGTEHFLLRLGPGTGREGEDAASGIGTQPTPLDPTRPALRGRDYLPVRLIAADENLPPVRLPLQDGDGDGIDDVDDACPADGEKQTPGVCGCGIADTDSDGDRTPDCLDLCVHDPIKTVPGLCGCGAGDDDRDGDLIPDCLDGCPDDPRKTHPGLCGCSDFDEDVDGDGVICDDNCPVTYNPAQVDGDGDGSGDACDLVTSAGAARELPGSMPCGVGIPLALFVSGTALVGWRRSRRRRLATAAG